MKLLHKKSKCCAASIIRYGGKRRQCTACKKTWRVHPAKRGPKSPRKQTNYLENVFQHGFQVKQLAVYSCLPIDVIYKRFIKNMESLIKKKRIVRIKGEHLILIIDAQWRYFGDKNKELWTLYFVSVKSTSSKVVTVLDPVLRQGKEGAAVWRQIIDQLPPGIKNRVIALVADGIRGIKTIANDNGWVLQSCHFHLLKVLQNMRGKRKSTYGRKVREKIYQTVALSLKVKSERRFNFLCKKLSVLMYKDGCPKRMRWAVSGYLKRRYDFRTYRTYPEFNLPTTINVMESINSFVERKTAKLRTPKSWHKWSTACVRMKSKFNCK